MGEVAGLRSHLSLEEIAGIRASMSITWAMRLLELVYLFTGGPSWRRRDGWGNFSKPLATWQGVRVDRQTGLPSRVNLGDNNLAGVFPELVAELLFETCGCVFYLDDNPKLEREGDVPASEREALTRFYHLHGGHRWTHKDNWCSAKPVHTWFGVTVVAGHVRVLWLDTNNLVGVFDETLGGLPKLQTLSLPRNHLQGRLPTLRGCADVKRVSLDRNRLSGPIPESWGSLSTLREVILSFNRLTGPVPSSLGSCLEMRRFNVDHNPGLQGTLPTSLEKWTDVEEVTINATRLEPGTVLETALYLRTFKVGKLRDRETESEVPSAETRKTRHVVRRSLSDSELSSIVHTAEDPPQERPTFRDVLLSSKARTPPTTKDTATKPQTAKQTRERRRSEVGVEGAQVLSLRIPTRTWKGTPRSSGGTPTARRPEKRLEAGSVR